MNIQNCPRKITSVAEDRSAFPSFLRPYAVVLSSPYANSPACNTPTILLVCAFTLPLRMCARVWFSMVVNANEWAMMPGCLSLFYPSFLWRSPGHVKKIRRKMVGNNLFSRDPQRTAAKYSVRYIRRKSENLSRFFLEFTRYAREWNYRNPLQTFRWLPAINSLSANLLLEKFAVCD